MGVIVYLVAVALILAGGFLIAYFWATKDGQFEDTYTPSVRILFEDEIKKKKDRTREINYDLKSQKSTRKH